VGWSLAGCPFDCAILRDFIEHSRERVRERRRKFIEHFVNEMSSKFRVIGDGKLSEFLRNFNLLTRKIRKKNKTTLFRINKISKHTKR
jgi:predicted solute-binding protein